MCATSIPRDMANTIGEAAIVLTWAVASYFLFEPVFDSGLSYNLGSVWTWLLLAATAVLYPVWTLLVVAMVGGHVRRLSDHRRHR